MPSMIRVEKILGLDVGDRRAAYVLNKSDQLTTERQPA